MSLLITRDGEIDSRSQIQTQAQIDLGTTIHQDIDAMRLELMALRQAAPRPFVFLKSSRNALSSNNANDVIIHAGPPVPVGFRGVIQDFNIIFGTAAGTIKLVIIDQSNQIITDVLAGVTATANGTGSTVIEEGDRLAVAGQVAGAGTFGVYFTGLIYKVI